MGPKVLTADENRFTCRTCVGRVSYVYRTEGVRFGNDFLQYRYNYVRCAYDARTIL